GAVPRWGGRRGAGSWWRFAGSGRIWGAIPAVAKKKKVRVELRKNRQKRTRSNDLTRQFRHDEPGAGATPATDRIRPRGELSRHRTIIEDVGGAEDSSGTGAPVDAAAMPAVDPATCLPGRTVRVH